MSIFDDILASDAMAFGDPDLMPGVEAITYTPRGEAPRKLYVTIERNVPIRDGDVVLLKTTLFVPRSAIPTPTPNGDVIEWGDERGDRKTSRLAEILKSDAGGYLLRLE